MRAAVDQQKRINSELRSELYALETGIASAHNKWNTLTNHINNTLATGANRVVSSHERTLQAYELEVEIEKMYKLFKNIELANKKIRACQNKIHYDFANYNIVRKIVQAMLNNIEVSFVSDKTITKAVEKKHLQLPDYWLTCALLSIMAWRNDDKVLAQRALERACKLDKKNTSIFFFAFHLRIGKSDTALKWFLCYNTCEKTGEDNQHVLFLFAIASRSIKEDCEDKLIAEVNKNINALIAEELKKSGYSEDEAIERVRSYLGAFRVSEALKYPVLANYCGEMSLLVDEMMSAKTNANVLDFILKTVNITNQEKNDYLNGFMDNLIASSNTTEKDVTNEIKYNEMVISHGGNVEDAKAEYDEWLTHNVKELNIINEMVDWIYRPKEDDVSPAEKLMMFVLTKNLSEQAIDRNVLSYRKRFKTKLKIKINEYESTADLAVKNSENGKINGYFDQKAASLIAQEKMWPCFVWFGVAVVSVLLALFVNTVFFAGLFVGVLGGILKIVLTNKKKEHIKKDCDMAAASTRNIFAQITDEFEKYLHEFKTYDAYYDDIKAEFAKI
jgi:hypothetical protein